ncbi:DUF6384 family protein [Rhodovulum sp. YNF3179]|uniref:DUF6384 family protein n=1 Tax=Rhodovulum sp. YNF3179 TaxID=3425127 RepID=UPI003D32F400
MTGADAGTAATRQPLDEVMMAMDVVDTLRRRERLVRGELDDASRRADLKARLKDIYEAQGIDVPDRILEDGVAALAANRFVFDPPEDSLAIRLARIYVTRDRWGKWVLGAVALVLVILAVNYVTVTRPNAMLGPRLAELHDQVIAVSTVPDATIMADTMLETGRAALDREDPATARAALEDLGNLRDRLDQDYRLRIVNEPGRLTGVWRVPEVNSAAQNYYIIVDALDPRGQAVSVPVENEETGSVERVSTWGLRVDKAIFERIAADKQDDGIIQNDIFGAKPRGTLEPAYAFPTTGAAITRW